jgi:hypothetical protein
MVSVFGWPDPNTGFDQSEHALYTCYFIMLFTKRLSLLGNVNKMFMVGHIFDRSVIFLTGRSEI